MKKCISCGATKITNEVCEYCGTLQVGSANECNKQGWPVAVFFDDEVYFAYDVATGADTEDFENLDGFNEIYSGKYSLYE